VSTETRPACRPLHEWFLEDFEPNGYVAGPPPWANGANARIDREIAEEATCDACGERDCRWWPVHNPTERSYRAFVRCNACGHMSEF